MHQAHPMFGSEVLRLNPWSGLRPWQLLGVVLTLPCSPFVGSVALAAVRISDLAEYRAPLPLDSGIPLLWGPWKANT